MVGVVEELLGQAAQIVIFFVEDMHLFDEVFSMIWQIWTV